MSALGAKILIRDPPKELRIDSGLNSRINDFLPIFSFLSDLI
jgi:hypothetical protein